MPTSHTQLSIYQAAMDVVSSRVPLSTSEDSPEVRWLNRNWDQYREMALRANLWSFSIELHSLDADGDYDAIAGWSYRYTWPNNAIRLIRPTLYGRMGYPPIPCEVRGLKLYCNVGAPLPVRFVMNESIPANWDPLFAEVIIASLAEGLAHKFVHLSKWLQIAQQRKKDAIEMATQVDAFEAGMEEAEVYDIIRAREL